MSRRVAAVAMVMWLLAPGAARVASARVTADGSSNVQSVARIPEMAAAISIGFIGDTMFVSTVHGLYSWDVSDPTSPQLLGALPMYIWENEDIDVDPGRDLVFISRDPRGFTSPATTAFPYGALHVIDVSNPSVMRQVSFTLLPVGHTSTCVDGCNYIWTGGPSTGLTDPGDWGGRPLYATDLHDPANPKPCPDPLDLGRNDGKTDYAHDVQVDANGVAWVSGRGGIRGYWVRGRHRDPVTGRLGTATGCAPIPYAGGGSPESATTSRFMHNAWRNVAARAAPNAPRGSVLYATEENITSNCSTSGRFATYDLRTSMHGEGWRHIDRTKFRMKVLDTWTPEAQPGSTGCASAHYFSDRGDGVLAYAFYEQGTRFLDASHPRNIRQIGWWHPSDANTWAAYWHGGYVFVADLQRGIDVLRFTGRPGGPAVTAPAVPVAQDLPADPATGFTCRLRLAPAAA